jgi:hypothetical protein
MYAALTFDESLFPTMLNINLWLQNQAGEKLAALGDLAIRGKYAVAYARKRRQHFVYRHSDRLAGTVPLLADCKAGVVLDQGVTAYAAK